VVAVAVFSSTHLFAPTAMARSRPRSMRFQHHTASSMPAETVNRTAGSHSVEALCPHQSGALAAYGGTCSGNSSHRGPCSTIRRQIRRSEGTGTRGAGTAMQTCRRSRGSFTARIFGPLPSCDQYSTSGNSWPHTFLFAFLNACWDGLSTSLAWERSGKLQGFPGPRT